MQDLLITTWTRFQARLAREGGAGLAEYGLVAVLIAIVALIAVQFTGAEVSETYSEISSGLDSAGN